MDNIKLKVGLKVKINPRYIKRFSTDITENPHVFWEIVNVYPHPRLVGDGVDAEILSPSGKTNIIPNIDFVKEVKGYFSNDLQH